MRTKEEKNVCGRFTEQYGTALELNGITSKDGKILARTSNPEAPGMAPKEFEGMEVKLTYIGPILPQ